MKRRIVSLLAAIIIALGLFYLLLDLALKSGGNP